jgi:hypothetical protein
MLNNFMVKTSELIILSEAARIVGVSGMWMRHLADIGALPVQRLANGTRLFRLKDVAAYIERRKKAPPKVGRPARKKKPKKQGRSKTTQ